MPFGLFDVLYSSLSRASCWCSLFVPLTLFVVCLSAFVRQLFANLQVEISLLFLAFNYTSGARFISGVLRRFLFLTPSVMLIKVTLRVVVRLPTLTCSARVWFLCVCAINPFIAYVISGVDTVSVFGPLLVPFESDTLTFFVEMFCIWSRFCLSFCC